MELDHQIGKEIHEKEQEAEHIKCKKLFIVVLKIWMNDEFRVPILLYLQRYLSLWRFIKTAMR
ncbi:MAG: hypothetical protein AMS26_23705 [Bacteroides sp. SM23_62]|nr:MAG: hypothetical protein AMS26_23705 [Bacteroides sp. SM23_62]